MERTYLQIEGIPAILWGPPSDRLLLAVHGNQSHKADTVIEIVARVAVERDCQVLSFDLPQHGGRKDEPRLCDAQSSVEDLTKILQYARQRSGYISVFGCSIGAYFALLAYQNAPVEKAFFLSPVVDMNRLIHNMMQWFGVSEERLQREQTVETPMGPLYWHYLQYVRQHPVAWHAPAAILYGERDELCEYEYIKAFAEGCGAGLTVLAGSEHFFHSDGQLAFLEKWLGENMAE